MNESTEHPLACYELKIVQKGFTVGHHGCLFQSSLIHTFLCRYGQRRVYLSKNHDPVDQEQNKQNFEDRCCWGTCKSDIYLHLTLANVSKMLANWQANLHQSRAR